MTQRIGALLHNQAPLIASSLSEQAQTFAQRYGAQLIALKPFEAATNAAPTQRGMAIETLAASAGDPERFQSVDLDSSELPTKALGLGRLDWL